MIPISLTIEGLYSYQSRQTIDFKVLTDAGLFGVFGAVGSGKSSILEAITFALYGETERMNSKESRNYNMMNLRSNQTFISFEFLNFENKKYKIERIFQRNSKTFADVKPKSSVLYHWENETWVPQESNNVTAILGGLSYDNFKRTNIIPQGKFKEFLELGPSDRTRMLKELFNLQRFDLKFKTKGLYDIAKSEVDHLKGQLMPYESNTAIHIEELKELLSIDKQVLSEKQTAYNPILEKLQAQKKEQEERARLALKEEEFEKLEAKLPDMEVLEKKIELYEQMHTAFSAPFSRQLELQKDHQIKSQQLETATAELQKTRASVTNCKQTLDVLQKDFDRLSQLQMEAMDLTLIQQIVSSKAEVLKIKERQQNGNKYFIASQDEVQNLKEKIKQQQIEVDELKKNKPDLKLIMELGKWYSEHDILQQQLSEATKSVTVINAEIQNYIQQITAEGVHINTYENDLLLQKEKIQNDLAQLDTEMAALRLQEQLSQYAHTLHDGTPCPLCGSLDHPEIKVIEDVTEALEAIKIKYANFKQQLLHIDNQKTTIDKIATLMEAAIVRNNDNHKTVVQLNEKIATHTESFHWQSFDPKNKEAFTLQKENYNAIEIAINKAEPQIINLRNDLNKKETEYENAKKKMEELKLDLTKYDTQIILNTNNLQYLLLADYESHSIDALKDMHQQWVKRNENTKTQFELNNNNYNSLINQIAGQESKVQGLNEQVIGLNESLKNLEQQIHALLEKHEMTSTTDVQLILDKPLDVIAERSKLHDFKVEYKSLKNQIEDAKIRLAHNSFDATQFEELVTLEQRLKETLDAFKKNVAQLEGNIQREEADLKIKISIQSMLEKKSERFTNLEVMKKLFEGDKFVDFASAIQMRQLCKMANDRFHRLTRNQLSLSVSDANYFEVIDYINGGNRRSVKTLSGGQTFQVSLSLALALAETVPSNVKADKSFFFIDEGFGTQDAESVNLIFETLVSLQKENRIVGIISHVDELKEKIPVSLLITNDEEHGSTIQKSWE